MAGKVPKLFTRAIEAQILRRNTRSLDHLLAHRQLRSICIGYRGLISEGALCELIQTGRSVPTPRFCEEPNA